jgi:UDP-N-acetylglucosamine 2-epimerase (non-hydrolysing)
MKRVLLVAGTRPEVIKVAPILLAAKNQFSSSLRVGLCLTGQHHELASEALSIFGIEEDQNLQIMSPKQTLNDISRLVLERLSTVLESYRPEVVMVQGDTTTASISALCAFNLGIRVAHVEAGLRSHDLTAPFPEELNRKIISCAATYNFCPTESSRANLLRESICEQSIYVTGNTIVDALRIIRERHDLGDLRTIHPSIRHPYILVTAHRRESFGKGIRNICHALRTSASRYPQYQFVYPVHPNPNINDTVQEMLSGIPNVILLPPVSYLELLSLLKNSEFALSDSGGIQEEAPSFGKYCIVLRTVTERGESIQLGISELTGTDPDRILDAIARRIDNPNEAMPQTNPYGDGYASEKILTHLIERGA